jgi:hypothetical protein
MAIKGARQMRFACFTLALFVAAPAYAQEARPVAPVVAAQDDRQAIGAAVDAVYAVISGPVGKPRDWARMRTLFTPEARLTPIGSKGPVGGTVEDYIAKSRELLTKSGFTERELARRVEIYGDLAHVWSSYEGIGTNIRVRGINSFQLVKVNGRWLVQSILWQAESPARLLPADMLGTK